MDQLTALLTKAHEAQRLINEVREAWNERCAAALKCGTPALGTPTEIDAFETLTQFMRPSDFVRMIVHAMNLECEQLAEAEITKFGEERALSRFKRQ